MGLDAHKRTYSVTLWGEQRNSIVTRWTQPANPNALIKTLTPHKDRVDRAVYEVL